MEDQQGDQQEDQQEDEEEEDQLTPTRNRMANLSLVVPRYSTARRTSTASTTSTTTEDSDLSESDTNLSGETLFSPPTSPPDYLPKVLQMEMLYQTEKQEQQMSPPAEAAAEPVQPVEKAQFRQRENNPLSYVDALRAKIYIDEDKGAYEGKSRGLWDYWRGRET